MTGEVIPADQARRIGLVTELVPHGRLLERALELAHAAADAPSSTMCSLKRMYAVGTTSIVGGSRMIADEISLNHEPDFDALELRRIAIIERNRAQLG